jgi:hypothetical protein
MRYLYLAILALACSYCGFAQNRDKFRTVFLSETGIYFSDATIKEDGSLEIQAIDSIYQPMDISKKDSILEYALRTWNGEMIFVHSGYIREIWRRNINTGAVSQVGVWNLNNPELFKYRRRVLETTKKHPWFFYAGVQSNFNLEGFSMLVSAHIGFFLLKDRWDLALSESFGLSTSETSESVDLDEELALISKVYFPIKKYKISPYIGAGSSFVFSNVMDKVDIYGQTMFLAGISWYVGPGSLDLGAIVYLDFRDPVKCSFNLSLGYTFLFK